MDNDLNIKTRVEAVLDLLMPFLKEDDGSVEFVRFERETGVVEVRFLGNCKTCPMSQMTLRAGIERFILKYIPEAKRIEAVI